MTENRMFTLCRTCMITCVVFLRMFLKFYQQLTGEERMIPFIFDNFHFCRSRVIGLDMTENSIFTLCRTCMITCVVFLRMFLKFYQQLTGEERKVPFIFGRNNQ
jgi:hypothetical protein